MNWNAVRFDWNQARAFLVTAEEGSLTAAAQKLALTQPTIGRQIAALEAELGVTLFDRVGRGLELTPTGASLLDHVRLMAEGASALSLGATGQSAAVEGTVTVSASEGVAVWLLPQILKTLHQTAPGIRVELDVSNDLQDLRRRDADIAIRHADSPHGDLITRSAGLFPVRFYAARSMLPADALPQSLEELQQLDHIGYRDPLMTQRLDRFLAEIGVTIPQSSIIATTDNDLARWQLVRQGLGYTMQMDAIACQFDDVIPLLPDFVIVDAPTQIVTHRELRTSARIRLVFDHLVEGFLNLSKR
ncbi:MAG: LysR family transcriptional regulator [Alphaproteobacteria bacterium]